MKGAKALAIPVKFGQALSVKVHDKKELQWQSYVNGKLWFSASFNADFTYSKASNEQTADFLSKLLKSAQSLNPKFLSEITFDIRTDINFNIEWGLGSSSTLIHNLAQWANINPFDLFFKVASGSAYDIACAGSDNPIIYRLKKGKPDFRQINFYPDFHQNIYFAYLGNKQKSEKSILKFNKKAIYSDTDINTVSEITEKMLSAKNTDEFSKLVYQHEQILSKILRQKTVKERYFSDFSGEIKSLGAWGGDFIMIVSLLSFEQIKKYFSEKGINIIFTFEEMIK
jgi:hypothetical protein